MCRDNSHHLIKNILGICLYSMLSSVKCPKFDPKWPLSYFQPILSAILVSIATVKVEFIPDFYTLANILINKSEENGEKQINFSLNGGQE